jgi:hypothetical protein
MRAFLRILLRKAAILAVAWALIVTGVLALRAGGHQLGVALLSLVLITAGILLGLGAQLPLPERRNS